MTETLTTASEYAREQARQEHGDIPSMKVDTVSTEDHLAILKGVIDRQVGIETRRGEQVKALTQEVYDVFDTVEPSKDTDRVEVSTEIEPTVLDNSATERVDDESGRDSQDAIAEAERQLAIASGSDQKESFVDGEVYSGYGDAERDLSDLGWPKELIDRVLDVHYDQSKRGERTLSDIGDALFERSGLGEESRDSFMKSLKMLDDKLQIPEQKKNSAQEEANEVSQELQIDRIVGDAQAVLGDQITRLRRMSGVNVDVASGYVRTAINGVLNDLAIARSRAIRTRGGGIEAGQTISEAMKTLENVDVYRDPREQVIRTFSTVKTKLDQLK